MRSCAPALQRCDARRGRLACRGGRGGGALASPERPYASRAGDLNAIIKRRRGAPLPEATILGFFVQMALGLKHVHDRKILHRWALWGAIVGCSWRWACSTCATARSCTGVWA